MARCAVILYLVGCLLSSVCTATEQVCFDKHGQWRRVWEKWEDGNEMCTCNYPERYLPDPPPFSKFSAPEAQCRLMGCEDRFTSEFRRPGAVMFNEAFNVTCECIAGVDPNELDQGLPDLYHWDCSANVTEVPEAEVY